jgi:hypothetical protein
MRVTLSELRPVRRRGLTLRSAPLGPVGALLVETPPDGSADTTLETLCRSAHWAVVMRGELELERARRRWTISGGQPFYVPAGDPPHRFRTSRRTLIAGFVPRSHEPRDGSDGEVEVLEPWPPHRARDGEVEAISLAAGPWLMTRSAFGSRAGYGSQWCDVAHWGLALTGSGVIEYEDDVEVLSAGDFFYCAAGPPGHKIEVADGATFVDFTPRDAIADIERVAEWRRPLVSEGA